MYGGLVRHMSEPCLMVEVQFPAVTGMAPELPDLGKPVATAS